MSQPSTKENPSNSLSRSDYLGGKSTLCTGCGHDSISNHIISSLFQSQIQPYDVAKMSGIGCSSKTPGYFLGRSHGFNSMHGRMAPVATGAKVANAQLNHVGVSGDGDTASIGLGGFVHLIRRNLPITYIIANNGVYGLTKGQFSATAERGSPLKSGEINPFEHVDLCTLAMDVGCSFVARSFSGDGKQMIPLLSAAYKHRGTAVIDVISPCVTFNNHEGSTKSYPAIKEHNIPLHELGFIPAFEEKSVDYAEGESVEVEMHDGSMLTLRKLDQTHDVHDRIGAIQKIHQTRAKGEVLTGLLYVNEETPSLIETLNIGEKPLAHRNEETRPSAGVLEEILKEFT